MPIEKLIKDYELQTDNNFLEEKKNATTDLHNNFSIQYYESDTMKNANWDVFSKHARKLSFKLILDRTILLKPNHNHQRNKIMLMP